jgi:hypothetical protein
MLTLPLAWKTHINENEIRNMCLHCLQPTEQLDAIGEAFGWIARSMQADLHDLAYGERVVDNEHELVHVFVFS